jgi:hypothetical protein
MQFYVVGGGVSESGAYGTIKFSLVDEVKSLPVSTVFVDGQAPVWRHHFRLPKPGIVSAFAVVTLPMLTATVNCR